MKPHRVTPLMVWMTVTGRTDTKLAGEITELIGRPISARQVARWRKGDAIPRVEPLKALHRLSEGQLDANAFVEMA